AALLSEAEDADRRRRCAHRRRVDQLLDRARLAKLSECVLRLRRTQEARTLSAQRLRRLAFGLRLALHRAEHVLVAIAERLVDAGEILLDLRRAHRLREVQAQLPELAADGLRAIRARVVRGEGVLFALRLELAEPPAHALLARTVVVHRRIAIRVVAEEDLRLARDVAHAREALADSAHASGP